MIKIAFFKNKFYAIRILMYEKSNVDIKYQGKKTSKQKELTI